MTSWQQVWRWMLAGWLACVLAACGGGGGSDASPPPAESPAAISVQPVSTSAVSGTAATFSISATGTALSYQWQRSSDGGTNWAAIAGANAASYALATVDVSMNGQQFRVVVTGTGGSVTSSAVTLSVTAAVTAPAIGVQPAAQTASAGGSASFSVTASGSSLAYQWQDSRDAGSTWAAIAGATAATLTLPALTDADNGRQLRVVVSNSAGSVTSAAVTLTVNPAAAAPAITAQPASASVTAPASASFVVVASGTPAPGCQWQQSTDGKTWTAISGATSCSYTTPATSTADSGKQFRAVVSNSAGSVTSAAATLTVSVALVAPTISNQPQNATITVPAAATFAVVAAGTPTPTYQWQQSTDAGATFVNVNGATGASYTTPATVAGDNGKRLRVVVSNSAGSVTSTAAVLTVNAYSISINVAGLTGTGLVVTNNGGDDLAITANGTTTFATPLPDGAGYAVTVRTQPTGQSCSVSGGSGTVSAASVKVRLQCMATASSSASMYFFSDTRLTAYRQDAVTGVPTAVAPTVATLQGAYNLVLDGGGRYVYAGAAGGLYGFSIDPTTGALTSLPGSPFATNGGTPYTITVHPNGRVLYFNVQVSAGIFGPTTYSMAAYAIDPSTGAATPIAGSSTQPNSGFAPLVIHPSGQWAYAITGVITTYAINATTGALTFVGPTVSTDAGVPNLVIHPTGKFGYVNGTNGIQAFAVNAQTGQMSSIVPALTGANVVTPANTPLVIDPSGSFLYSSGGMQGFRIDPASGRLTPLPGSPFTLGGTVQATSLKLGPVPNVVYALYGGSTVAQLRIDPATGALTLVPGTTASFSTGVSTLVSDSLKFDRSGRFAYVFDQVSPNVAVMAVDPSSGALSAPTLVRLPGVTSGNNGPVLFR